MINECNIYMRIAFYIQTTKCRTNAISITMAQSSQHSHTIDSCCFYYFHFISKESKLWEVEQTDHRKQKTTTRTKNNHQTASIQVRNTLGEKMMFLPKKKMTSIPFEGHQWPKEWGAGLLTSKHQTWGIKAPGSRASQAVKISVDCLQ